MNHLPNGAVAVGAPGSIMRKRSEQEDSALGVIRKAYREQASLPTLAINQTRNCIGAWDKTLGRFVTVACYALTDEWVSVHYEILVNGKHLAQDWKPIPREMVSGYPRVSAEMGGDLDCTSDADSGL